MDRNLLQAAHAGDPRAREAVLGRWLRDELRALFKDDRAGEIDELVQASAEEIIREFADAPDDPAAFRTWVLGFAGTRAWAIKRDMRREQARVLPRSPGHTPAESLSAILRPLLDMEKRELVIHYAQQLRPIHRIAIMHVLDGGDYRSLAASEGIREITAWHRLSRATKLVGRSIELHRRTRPSCRT